MKRVVITGMGVVSPLGSTVQDFWSSLLTKECGIRPLTKLDSERYKGNSLSAEVQGLDKVSANQNGQLDPYGKAIDYATTAAKSALRDAGLPEEMKEANNHAVIIGTTSGNQDMVERTINAFDIQNEETELDQEAAEMLFHFRPIELSTKVAEQCNFGGPNMVIPTACAAGNYAFGSALSMIREGNTKVAIAGGADPFTRSCYTIFYRLGAMSQQDCRPFDQDRTGMVVGEGAGILVMEELEHALERGARIYAEVKDYALSCDAHHPTAPDPEGSGATIAMNQVLERTKLKPEEISFVSAHGTGTRANDAHEAKAMKNIFGEELKDLPVHGLKSAMGHCMGAASALEAIASVMSIKDQVIPPTLNTTKLDETFDSTFQINSQPKPHKVKNVLSNSFAFGGNICSVLFSEFNEN